MSTHISILGAGLLGRLLAWQLSQHSTTHNHINLYDTGSPNGEKSAAWVAAAMLAPTAEAIDATALVTQLGYQSLQLWQTWLPTLPQPTFFQQNGSLIIWHSQDTPLAQQFIQQLQHQHPNKQPWQHWQTQQIQQHEPQLSQRFQQALYLNTEGQLDNRQLLTTLAQALQHPNISCYWHTPITQPPKTDWLIDCRGMGSQTDWNQLSGSQLRGVRGEVLRIYAPEVQLNRPIRLLHPRYPIYITPKPNHIFVIGATQIESENQDPITIRSALELMSALYTVHPAFGEATLLETASALRPTLNHDNPEIRYHTSHPYISINGLYRHGFMIAPAVVAATQRLLYCLQHQQTPPTHDPITHIPYTPITTLPQNLTNR